MNIFLGIGCRKKCPVTPVHITCVCVSLFLVHIWTVTSWPRSSGALQIENSEESDQGKYECVAVNSAGTRYSAPANLYVRGKIPLDPERPLPAAIQVSASSKLLPSRHLLLCRVNTSWKTGSLDSTASKVKTCWCLSRLSHCHFLLSLSVFASCSCLVGGDLCNLLHFPVATLLEPPKRRVIGGGGLFWLIRGEGEVGCGLHVESCHKEKLTPLQLYIS